MYEMQVIKLILSVFSYAAELNPQAPNSNYFKENISIEYLESCIWHYHYEEEILYIL